MTTKSPTDLAQDARTLSNSIVAAVNGPPQFDCEWLSLLGKAAGLLDTLAALIIRCVPPEYMVEPAFRSCDKEWVWDSCDDDWNGYGEADSREQALADAWIHWRAREKERADDREEAKDLARFEP